MKYLFLSPHYDDAIYSCGGTIYELSQQGHEVEIMTIMAGVPQQLPETPVLKDNHQRWDVGNNPILVRRVEDQNAAKIVGATIRYLDLLDCIYRVNDDEALYPTESSLWQTIHPNDPTMQQLHTIDLKAADMIFAPLGVGEHVDHLIVRDWAWQLAQNGLYPVQFYVEYPYMRNQQVVDKAYDNFPAELISSKRSFSEMAMQHKIKAMTAYQSQIKSFWESESEIETEVRQTFWDKTEFIEEFATVDIAKS